MTKEQVDRGIAALEGLAVQFGRIADALEGLNGTAKGAANRFWPEPREPREPVVSRIPTEEDKAKENQGRIDESESIEDWLSIGNPEESWGEREREWRKAHPDSGQQPTAAAPDASAVPDTGPEGGGVATAPAEGEAGAVGDSAAPNCSP